jgi:hypothetical protein
MADDHRSATSYAPRRSSMYSQHVRYGQNQNPPLPHQVQAHFYGAPDANLLLSPPGPGLIPGENGYYCGLDSVANLQDSSRPAEQVVVTGYSGGLDLYTVTKRGLSKLLTLDGLRGGVFAAKILPASASGGYSHLSPLIALVVHGPYSLSSGSSNDDDAAVYSVDGASVRPTESVKGSPKIHGLLSYENDDQEFYQTTVEVYSLVSKQYVTTLLVLPKIRLPIPSSSSLFKPPPALGALTIRAEGSYVVIASGTSGETWLFQLRPSKSSPFGDFKCIGKVWTGVQHGVYVDPSGANGNTDSDWYTTESVERKQYKASILSLSGRWLAYSPSAPSSQVSLRAVVPGIPPHAKVPGLNAHAPPHLPSINCMVETPEGESVVKQIMQAGTQALIEGTTYIGKQIGRQGAQVWNNYWNKPAQPQPIPGGTAFQNHISTHQFPPTHGAQLQTPVIKDPGLVSILDLDYLSRHTSFSSSPHPLATFKPTHGCSFLSFAPSGLALFTASSKGDMQSVWDLMRIQYAKSSFLKSSFQGADNRGPHVRQIAHFSRMTIARIVDVVWSSPHGERAAMVTEPGTVHVLDLPASAFIWPPPRRRTPSQKPTESNTEGISSGLTASGVATSAVSSLWTVARPLVRARRQSAAGMSAKTVTAQAGHGTHALAAGISRSMGAATGRVNEIRKGGNGRIQLPRSVTIPSKACIVLLNHKRNDSIIVVGGGIVRFYTIKNRRENRSADKQKATRGANYVEFRLPSLPDFRAIPDDIRTISPIGNLEHIGGETEEQQWATKKPAAAENQASESSIPQAEIESNAPYQPFHTDRRVGMYIYAPQEPETDPHVSALLLAQAVSRKANPTNSPPWAFGCQIKTLKLDVGPMQNPEDDSDGPLNSRALPTSAIERILMVKDNNEEMEQIVITTRRRKGATRVGAEATAADEEGFFEDDCEVLDFASQRV